MEKSSPSKASVEENIEMSELSKGKGAIKPLPMVRATSTPNISAISIESKQKKSSKSSVRDFIINLGQKKEKKRPLPDRALTAEDTPTPAKKVGRGHRFLPYSLKNPTWCDQCGDFIWGVYKQAIRCDKCKLICHWRCKEELAVDCFNTNGMGDPKIPRHVSVDEITLQTLQIIEKTGKDGLSIKDPLAVCNNLTRADLIDKVEKFNSQTTGLIMTMRDDITFQGFVRVHMNLIRPINIIAGERPLSIYEAVSPSKNDGRKVIPNQRTSFFLPVGTVKALHVTSYTTVYEVIVALLNKFRVTDNPRKFALYERTQKDGNRLIIRRMADTERPLILRLLWGPTDSKHSFSLQENESGDIMWEAFSLPELQNFLKVLDHEEEEHLSQVKAKYEVYKDKLQQALNDHEQEREQREQPEEKQPVE